MSWWFGININGYEIVDAEHRNMTYNLSTMLYNAFEKDFRSFNDVPCSEAKGPFKEALNKMLTDPDKYREFNPPNGWGNYETAVDNLRWMVELCEKYPEGTVYIN